MNTSRYIENSELSILVSIIGSSERGRNWREVGGFITFWLNTHNLWVSLLGRDIDAVIEGSASVDVRGTAEDIGEQRL